MTGFSLNPELDVDSLAADYARAKRGSVRSIFPKEQAEELHRILKEDVPWELTYFDGENSQSRSLDEMRALSAQERMAFQQQRMQQARDGFAYCYNTFKFHEAIKAGEHLDHPLKAFDDFLSSPPIIEFIRALIGDEDVSSGGGHATWFAPGHYLTTHTDKIPGVDRRAAFVFNLTKRWMPDWGGELKFYDQGATRVEEAFIPSFNTLNVFTVPKPHSVGFVSPFAGGPRLAITGWFYAGDSPL